MKNEEKKEAEREEKSGEMEARRIEKEQEGRREKVQNSLDTWHPSP